MSTILSAELPSDLSKDEVRGLARALGLTIPDENLAEVTYRYNALMEELSKLMKTDLGNSEPLPVFSAEGDRAK